MLTKFMFIFCLFSIPSRMKLELCLATALVALFASPCASFKFRDEEASEKSSPAAVVVDDAGVVDQAATFFGEAASEVAPEEPKQLVWMLPLTLFQLRNFFAILTLESVVYLTTNAFQIYHLFYLLMSNL